MGGKPSTRRRGDCLGPATSQIGSRLRHLREQKGLFQRDIEERAGLLTCYISRVENGYKLPSLGTLERFALALDVPLYRLFYDGDGPPPAKPVSSISSAENLMELQGEATPDIQYVEKLARLWNRMGRFEHRFLLDAARRLAARSQRAVGKDDHEPVDLAVNELTSGSDQRQMRAGQA